MATTKFSVNVRKWAETAQLSAEQATRAATLEMFTGVVRKSPVDKGTFRGNWQVDQRGFSYDKTDPSGQKTIVEITEKVMASRVGGIISLINNLPYSEVLEVGGYPGVGPKTVAGPGGIYSKQAPQGMVRLTAMEFTEAAEEAARKERR